MQVIGTLAKASAVNSAPARSSLAMAFLTDFFIGLMALSENLTGGPF